MVLTRDKASGKAQVKQVLRGGPGKMAGLAGAFGVDVSPDGKFVYSVSGRFGGDDAVCAYRFDAKEGTLAPVQEIVRGAAAKGQEDPLTGFEGGNEIVVAPDGRNVYAVATKSGALAAFARDAATGKLKLVKTIKAEDAVAGGAGVTVSPDWRFVYVAAENHNAVSAFRRR